MGRDYFIDFLKWFLIFLVVVGHLLQFVYYGGNPAFWDDSLYKAIYMFHMPLFMAISGFVVAPNLVRKPLLGAALKRGQQLLLPLLAWCIIWAVLSVALLPNSSFVGSFLASASRGYWFIWAAFLSYVVGRLIMLLPASPYLLLPSASIAFVLLPIDQYILVMTRYTFPFFCLGYLLGYSQWTPPKNILWLVFFGSLSVGCFVAWSEHTYVYNNGLRWVPDPVPVVTMFVGALCASAFAVLALRLVWEWIEDTATARLLSQAGQYTLQVYLAQEVFFRLWAAKFESLDIPYPLFLAAAILTSAGVTIGFVRLVSRTPRMVSRLLWGV